MIVALRRLKRPLLRIGGVVFLGICSGLFWLVEPFWRIRITHMWSARLGELALTTHTYVASRILYGEEPRTTRVFIAANPCNRQLLTMWKRILPILESRLLSALYQASSARFERNRFFRPLDATVRARGQNAAIDQVGPVISFSVEEERRGHDLLRRMGLTPADWFVCIQARDPSFHTQRVGMDAKGHRSCRIETFLPAAQAIVARGGAVIRVGATAERPLPDLGHPRIIDYTWNYRDDFGDIYLLGHCRFFMCGATGTSSVPTLFNIPIAAVNMLPLTPNPWGRSSLMAPKRLRRIHDSTILTFVELKELKALSFSADDRRAWDDPDHYRRLGIEPVDNDEQDLVDIVEDMMDASEDRLPSPEAVKLQRLYKERFFSESPDFVRFGPNIGPRYALRYRALIEA